MIRFRCPACDKAQEAPDILAGTKGPCPSCGQRLQFPVPVTIGEKPKPTANDSVSSMPDAAVIRFPCPKCGTELSAPKGCAGRSSKCRACGQPVTVPLPAAGAPVAPKEKTPEEQRVEDYPMVLPVPEDLPPRRPPPSGKKPKAPARGGRGARNGKWSAGQIVALVSGITLPLGLLAVVFLAVVFLAVLLFFLSDIASFVLSPNAKCRSCGHEWHIREVRSLDDAFRTERCPECGRRDKPNPLLQEYDRHHD